MNDLLKPDRDPLGWSTPAPIVEEFSALGSALRLDTNSEDILRACRESFGRYHPPAARADEGKRVVVRLLVDSSFREAPPWPEPVFRAQSELFYVCVGRQNTAVANIEKWYATGFLSPAMARDSSYFRRVFLDCLVLTILTHGRTGIYSCVHASAVARADTGLILSGPSRSGKTTLAYACARRGFHVVSDDVVYLREEDGGVHAWGKPWHLRFLSDAASLFPELALRDDTRVLHEKDCVEIDVESVLPGRTQVRCRPAAILFLERSGGGAECVPLAEDEAIRRLSCDLVYDVPAALARHRRHWLALVRRGAYVFRVGEDLDRAVDLLESFVEK